MIKKIHYILVFIILFTHTSYAQNITVSNISATNRFASCGQGLPNITATLLNSTGSTLVNGTLVCNDPCGTSTVRINMTNIRWNQTPGINWIHGIFFSGNSGVTVAAVALPLGWAQFNSCVGATCTAQIAGGTGFYFDAVASNSCFIKSCMSVSLYISSLSIHISNCIVYVISSTLSFSS